MTPPRNPKQRPGSYRIHIRCDNCGHGGLITVPRGLPVQSAECEVCGCKGTLRKVALATGFRVEDD